MTASPTRHADRTVLAIETSCDETCAAVVRGRGVVSDVVASQFELHRSFGGVVPEIASRRHLELIDDVVDEALRGVDGPVDAIAVTQGPGLAGALLVGLAHAKARAWACSLPLIAVDHLYGHVMSALLAPERPEPPFLCLLVSGGHTMLLDVDEAGVVMLLGSTRDDAAGEAFDKSARVLGLATPGGPALEEAARRGSPDAVPVRAAMVSDPTLDTSFAGIKTAVVLAVRGGQHEPADVAAACEVAIVGTLVAAVRRALVRRGSAGADGAPTGVPDRDRLAVVGGVAANLRLRADLEALCADHGVQLSCAPLRWCGDNAVMIGVASQWMQPLDPSRARAIDAYATSPLFRSGTLVPNTRL